MHLTYQAGSTEGSNTCFLCSEIERQSVKNGTEHRGLKCFSKLNFKNQNFCKIIVAGSRYKQEMNIIHHMSFVPFIHLTSKQLTGNVQEVTSLPHKSAGLGCCQSQAHVSCMITRLQYYFFFNVLVVI